MFQAFRDNDRVSIDDPQLATYIWTSTGLRDALAYLLVDGASPAGLNSYIRLYRYSVGQRFGRHIDESVAVDKFNGETKYTLLIYLSEPSGGETVFYDNRGRRLLTVHPKSGLALLHRHGECCLEHEALQVKAGVKYVLRTDVVF